jgi:methionyl-tRNA formyltransferase
MPLREVLQFPDARLKRKSEPVAEITDEIRALAQDMIEVMYDEPGIGLAAPQVGEAIRLVVMDTSWNEEDGEKDPRVMVNPEIVERDGTITWTEGCLSVPDFQADVERAEHVVVRYTDLDGNAHEEDRRLLPARDRPPRRDPLHRSHQPPEAQPVHPEAQEGALAGAGRGTRQRNRPLTNPERLVFFGTPEFAVPTLQRLIDGPHEVVAVVSQPDRRRGRGRKLSPSPVAACAQRAGLPLLRPERVGAPEAIDALRQTSADLGVVAAFGQFLPKKVRELPRRGYLINAHASLLPRHRGAAPIAHALLAGDPETGISIMRVEREMDAGAVCLTKRLPIRADATRGTLEIELGELAADAVAEALEAIADESAVFTPQDHTRATLAPKLGSDDAALDFSQPAALLARRVRALAPRPGTVALLEGERLRIHAAHALAEPANAEPGALRRFGEELRVATGDGWLVLERVQRAGGRVVSVADWLRGAALPEGARLERLGGLDAAAG